MAATLSTNLDVIAKLAPGGAQSLAQLSDDELLANTRRLVGKTNQLLAALLAHLAEVETRGAHRSRRCASLYTYCIYELRFSEDAAARRSAAARFAKEFPALLDAVAAGELHLTGLLMIGPHLKADNHENVLTRARFRTKKELTKLIRELNPLPNVPDRIEPLSPNQELVLSHRNPSWEKLAASLCPQIRDLPTGDKPDDWANDGIEREDEHAHGEENASDGQATASHDALPVGPVPDDLPPVTGPQHFQMQFGTVEAHVQLVERAKALLARERPGVTLGELHLEAMKLLVAALEKRKLAVMDCPRQPLQSNPQGRELAGTEPAWGISPPAVQPARTEEPRQRGANAQVGESPAATPPSEADVSPSEVPRQRVDEPELHEPRTATPPQPSRYIAAAVRREVYRRDTARCTYVDPRGQRCCETRYLELHHLQPFAKNGPNVASNLTLRCAAHNALAAEEDFGTELIAERRRSMRHEALATQTRLDTSTLEVDAATLSSKVAGTRTNTKQRRAPFVPTR